MQLCPIASDIFNVWPDLEELTLGEGEVLLGQDVEEDVLFQMAPLLRVDQGLQRLVHLLRGVECDVVLVAADYNIKNNVPSENLQDTTL